MQDDVALENLVFGDNENENQNKPLPDWDKLNKVN